MELPNTITAPQWAGDFLNRDSLVPGGAKADIAQFLATDSAIVVVSAAGAAQGAVTIPLNPANPLANPIPANTLLYFGAGLYARTTALTPAGAGPIAVEDLPVAIPAASVAVYAGVGKKSLRSGILVGRTFDERDASTPFGPADAADDEIYIVAFAVADLAKNNDLDLYRHGRVVKENFLPEWATISADAALLAKLRALYTTTKGAA